MRLFMSFVCALVWNRGCYTSPVDLTTESTYTQQDEDYPRSFLSCNFESGSNHWCDFISSSYNNNGNVGHGWHLEGGHSYHSTPLPYGDHTYGSNYGHFMLTEQRGRNYGMASEALISPNLGHYYSWQTSTYCLTFWYQFYDMGLNYPDVQFVVALNKTHPRSIWSQRPYYGNQNWVKQQIIFTESGEFQLEFYLHQLTSSYIRTYLAVDDIELSTGSCYDETTYDYGYIYGTTTTSRTPIRLVNGPGSYAGRLEVYYGGNWGTVCDDSFTVNDANVVCRMLGYYNYGGAAWHGSSYYGQGSGRIVIDELRCSGYETDISMCSSNTWFSNDCGHSEDVGVDCYPAATTTSERLTTYVNPLSSLVCTFEYSDICSFENDTDYNTEGVWTRTHWSYHTTDVPSVDHTYGSSYGHYMFIRKHDPYEEYSARLTTPVLGHSYLSWQTYCVSFWYSLHGATYQDLFYVTLNNTNYAYDRVLWSTNQNTPYRQWTHHQEEIYVPYGFRIQFYLRQGYHNYHNMEAAVDDVQVTQGYCYEMTTYDSSPETSYYTTPIRLVNGHSPYEGRVEVYYGGSWGTVCDDSFTHADAEVICKLVGLNYWSGYATYYGNAHFGSGTGPITLDNLRCSGYETDISQCSSNGWLQHNCGHSEDVGVNCGTQVRLVGGSYPWEGKLEVMYKGTWGTVCDDSFGRREAEVACNMLGYGYRYNGYSNSYFRYAGTGRVLLDDLNCRGYESDLAECMTQGWGVENCDHSEDIGLYCYAPSSTEFTTSMPYTYETSTSYPWWYATTARRNRLEDAIYVSCSSSGWNIRVDLYKLRQIYPSARAEDIYLGENSCSGRSNGYNVYFTQGLRACLTSETVSYGSLVYKNQLIYAERDPYHPFIIRHYNWTLDVECDVARNQSISSHVSHESATSGPYHHVQSNSHYNVMLSFYRDSNFVDEIYGNPLHAKIGQNIYVKVHTDASDWRVKMRLHTCYTKPTTYAPDHLKYYLIKNGCEVDTNTHIISQSTHETKFVFQDFEYTTNHEGFQIYCDATYCETNDYSSQCEQTCNPRGKRDAQTEAESADERQTYVTETVSARIVNDE